MDILLVEELPWKEADFVFRSGPMGFIFTPGTIMWPGR